MDDIAPELAKQIYDLIAEAEDADAAISAIYDLISSGEATYAQAYELAEHIGGHISVALQAVLTVDVLPDGRLYYNIADRTVRPALETGYGQITAASADIQTALNAAAGFGIKGVSPELPAERIQGMVQKLSGNESLSDVAWLLDEPIKTLIRSAVDETIRENVELHARAGLSPRIVRIAESGCCKWCASLAGTYEYPAPEDVYRRHERCRCVVEYDPRDGGRRRQNVWTKRWTDPDENAKIEARKALGNERKRHVRIKNIELKNGLPINGIPNSILDKVDNSGKVLQRRIYGSDGKAAVDFDTSDHGMAWLHPTGAHKHIFDYSKKKPRGKELPLSAEELEQNSDIIRRGVNYHDIN